MFKWLALCLFLFLPGVANAACSNTWQVKDANGTVQTFCRGSDGTNFEAAMSLMDPTGANFAGVTANGLKVDPSAASISAKGSSGTTNLITCDQSAKYDASTSGDTQIVAASGSTSIYICGYSMSVGSVATNVKLDYGTGSNCGSGTTALTPAWEFASNGGSNVMSAFWNGLKTPASQALCVNASGANPVQVMVWFAQF